MPGLSTMKSLPCFMARTPSGARSSGIGGADHELNATCPRVLRPRCVRPSPAGTASRRRRSRSGSFANMETSSPPPRMTASACPLMWPWLRPTTAELDLGCGLTAWQAAWRIRMRAGRPDRRRRPGNARARTHAGPRAFSSCRRSRSGQRGRSAPGRQGKSTMVRWQNAFHRRERRDALEARKLSCRNTDHTGRADGCGSRCPRWHDGHAGGRRSWTATAS